MFDAELAEAFGIVVPDQVVVMFHCGSRGFGHQVATDYLQVFLKVMEKKYGIRIVDRELACAPFRSPEGQDYFAAMKCAINMSFVNRQVILHRIREVFSDVFGKDPRTSGCTRSTMSRTTRPSSRGTGSEARSGNCSSTGREPPGRSDPGWRDFPASTVPRVSR